MREPVFNVPPSVIGLVLLLGIIHVVLAFGLSVAETNALLEWFAFDPLRFAPGVSDSGLLPGGTPAAIWTFVTYALIHGNLNHLVFNLVWLLAFGTPVARRFGSARFLLLMAVTAAAGALAHLFSHFGENAPIIGASAAVSGAMAAATRFAFEPGGPLGPGPHPDNPYAVAVAPLGASLRNPRVLAFLAVWFGINLLFGLGSVSLPGAEQNVAWEAHIGGFLAGFLLFPLFDPTGTSGGGRPPASDFADGGLP